MKIFLAGSVLSVADPNFLLAQGGSFLSGIHDEEDHGCSKRYNEEYFHVLRIARNPESAFCNELTTGKQTCKARDGIAKEEIPFTGLEDFPGY